MNEDEAVELRRWTEILDTRTPHAAGRPTAPAPAFQGFLSASPDVPQLC